MARRVGVFGGSFDPIHVGHLMLAEFCRDAARLDEVRFIPAAQARKDEPRPRIKVAWRCCVSRRWESTFRHRRV
ncbi:MAG: adenylyltransferase/cytidyltransferase family protein [Pirellulaceae bacterium]